MNYYNDNDAFCCQWLRNLIAAGLIPPGHVDERSIKEVTADDLQGYTQCHFFAGIAGWSLALALAAWPVDTPVWTGSCPCQPFSAAGKRKGTADERHLWPEFRRLIAECGPPVVFGEQVASKDGREWLTGVRADLEGMGYAVGAADLCAASVGAPHIRQRLWWVAESECVGIRVPGRGTDAGATGRVQGADGERQRIRLNTGAGGIDVACGLADANGRKQGNGHVQRRGQYGQRAADSGPGRVGHTGGAGLQERIGIGRTECGAVGAVAWQTFELAGCRDGKARRFEPGSFPLAHGIPTRVGKLRAYGNAICPQVAAEFIAAYMEAVA